MLSYLYFSGNLNKGGSKMTGKNRKGGLSEPLLVFSENVKIERK
jgi:hypothetical protein